MKKIFTFLICSMGTLISVQAQSSRPGAPIGGVVQGGKNPGGSMLLNLGGGFSKPNDKSQSQNFLGNGYNVNGGLYIPLFTSGNIVGTGQTVHFFTAGPNVSGTFSRFKQTADGFPNYKITGQTGDTKPVPALDGNPTLFTIETGLHANFSFGKVTISPVLNGAYFNFKQDAFSAKQTNQVNGKEYTFDLYSQQKTEESGFAFIPKLRIGYFPGSLGFYLESNYTLGPDVSVEQSRLKPLGTGNDKDGSYQLDQLMAGKQVISERHTPFHNLALNFGVTYSFRRAAKKAARKAKSSIASSAIVNPIYEGSGNSGQNPTSEPQNQSIVNTTKSNTKDRVEVLNDKMMQVTYTGQDPILKNTKLSVLGSGKTLPNGTPIVAGREVKGIITGSVIISSGSARVTNTVTIKQPETGDERSAIVDKDGNFIVKLGSDTLHRIYINGNEFGKIKIESGNGTPQNQSIINTSKSNTKDRVSLDGTNDATTPLSAAPQSPLYQAQNTEHMSPLYKGSLARPGEPIGGIVVKGGRNPGGQMKLTTNGNGEFTFENAKPADFQFTVETPETTTGEGNNARPGGPIGGIIVKGGKNPGGQMLTLSSDENGVITLKDLPAGNYKFRVTAPTDDKQYESFRKGWDGTVKGGSKKNINQESPLYQAQNTEHMSPLYKGSLTRPGEPIGGIIVKGGRNPGGQMKLTTSGNGEFTFENAKATDFQFTIETPETNTSEGNNARPGEPIGGIIVKGGRNRGGQMLNYTSDPNGVVTIKNLPAGNYKFRVTAPTDTKQYESFRKGWDGTVKGGSKNNINKESPIYQPQNTEHMSPLYKGK